MNVKRLSGAIAWSLTCLLMAAPAIAETDDDLDLELVPIAPPAGTNGDAAGAEPEPAAVPDRPLPRETRTAAARPATPAPFDQHPARVRFTAEPGLQAPAARHARIGLFGVDLDVRPNDGFLVVGAGGFGAVTGTLGGLFGGGLSWGVRIGVAGPVSLDAGAMLGAGGGGGARTGSGLFLRPRAGLHVDLAGYGGHAEGATVGVSHLYFPSGDFSSTHLSLSFELAATAPVSPGLGARSPGTLDGRAWGASTRSFRFTSHGYFPLPARSLDAAGEPLTGSRLMLGLEFREFFTRHAYGLLEPRALAAGGRAGFAELTVGAGFAIPLDPGERVSVFGSGGIGAAGGGGMRTGGGLYLRGALGLDVDLPGPLHFAVDAGIQDAPRRGHFTAVSTGIRLGLTQEVVRPRAYAVRGLVPGDDVMLAGWRLRPSHASLFAVPAGGEEARVAHLLALKVDHMLGDHAYVSVAGASSWAGLSRGALSMGTVGVGGVSPEWNRIRLSGEARLGAAGGGGVGAGAGFVVQPMAGVHVAITDAVGIDVLGGWLAAPTGELSSPTVDVGLVYAFSTPRLRRD